jgi:predicted transcriptional regulator
MMLLLKRGETMSRTTYYIDDDLHRKVKEAARDRKVSGKVIVNEAIRLYFDNDISNKELLRKIEELLKK